MYTPTSFVHCPSELLAEGSRTQSQTLMFANKASFSLHLRRSDGFKTRRIIFSRPFFQITLLSAVRGCIAIFHLSKSCSMLRRLIGMSTGSAIAALLMFALLQSSVGQLHIANDQLSVTRILAVHTHDLNFLTLSSVDPSTFRKTELASIPTNVQDHAISQNNLLAYVPSYASHGGENAAGFINLESLFPCVANREEAVRCRKFTWEEDGANHGYDIVVITDRGNHLDIFGENVQTLGFITANPDCKQINPSQSSGCFPRFMAFTILCYVPSKNCE